MPRIRCFYEECVFLASGYCTAQAIELDPEDGCLTYSEDPEDLVVDEEDLIEDDEEDDLFEDEDWGEAGFEEIEDIDLEDEEF